MINNQELNERLSIQKKMKSKTAPLTAFVLLITLTPGPIFHQLYKFLVKYNLITALGIYKHKLEVISVLASYATTMLGFLTALIGLLLAITNSKAFIDYTKKGYLKVFFGLYTFAIITLVVMAISLILSFGATNTSFIFNISISLFVNSLIQVSIITWIISKLVSRTMQGK